MTQSTTRQSTTTIHDPGYFRYRVTRNATGDKEIQYDSNGSWIKSPDTITDRVANYPGQLVMELYNNLGQEVGFRFTKMVAGNGGRFVAGMDHVMGFSCSASTILVPEPTRDEGVFVPFRLEPKSGKKFTITSITGCYIVQVDDDASTTSLEPSKEVCKHMVLTNYGANTQITVKPIDTSSRITVSTGRAYSQYVGVMTASDTSSITLWTRQLGNPVHLGVGIPSEGENKIVFEVYDTNDGALIPDPTFSLIHARSNSN